GMVEYAKGLGLADCYFSVITPLPGSVLYTEAVEKGMLLETDVTKYRLYDTVLKHEHMSRQKVREMCVRANAKWYDDLMLPAEKPTIAVNVAMDPGSLTATKFLRNVLNDNPGISGKLNLARLVAAAGSEVAVAVIDRGSQQLREGVSGWVRDGKSRVMELTD